MFFVWKYFHHIAFTIFVVILLSQYNCGGMAIVVFFFHIAFTI